MPVDITYRQKPLYQRELYTKGGITRLYWDYRDKIALSFLEKNDQSIIDIGCGEGITLDKIRALFPGRRIIGLDGIIENLFICKKYNNQVIGGDAFQLPFKSNIFDCAIFLEVIEHLSDPGTAILEIRRILKPGAKLIIVFPNDFTFKMARILTLKFKEAAFDAGHLMQWSPKNMRSFLNRHGFEVLKQVNIPFYLWHFSLHHLVICRKEG